MIPAVEGLAFELDMRDPLAAGVRSAGLAGIENRHAFAAHVVGFVFGMGGVFVFKKRSLDPWDRAQYY